MNRIPIVLITDSNQIMQISVTITSIIHNANPTVRYEVSVLGIGISNEEKEKIQSLGTENVLVDVKMFDNKYSGIVSELQHVTTACNYKFDIPSIFKDYEKVLYLDTDIIVQSDLLSLYNTDLTDKYAAVVQDMHGISTLGCVNRTGCPNYFNAGMMLLNIQKINKDDCPKKIIEAKEKYGDECVDQDSFNRVIGNNCIFLPPKYNWMTNNYIYTEENIRDFYGLADIEPNRDSYAEIIHYTWLKPWHYRDLPLGKVWMKYYKLSSYGKTRLKLKLLPTEAYDKGCLPLSFFSVRNIDKRTILKFGRIKLKLKLGY